MTWPTLISRQLLPVLTFLPAIAVATGCDFLEQYEDSGGTVNVFTTHHGSPRDGEVTDRQGNAIRTTTDTGWALIINQAHLSTVAATLNNCDGERSHAVDMYFGSFAENLRMPDFELEGIGAVTVPEGKYCGVTVVYGPYFDEEGEDAPAPAELRENTVYFQGLATRDGYEVPFELSAGFEVAVTTSFDEPLKVDHYESFAKEISVAKTIDRFFDGIEDFDTMGEQDMNQHFAVALERETRAVIGTAVRPR